LERTKKSVSIPTSLVAAVEERIEDSNFSAYVAKAIQAQLLRDHLEELAQELDGPHGRPPQEAIDERARELLGL
jgi:hypothetical protein